MFRPRTVIKQNYFQFENIIYRQHKGLAMGAPSSSILSEVYLQYIEHTAIYDVLLRNQILGYFRYVDDILIVYSHDKTNINEVLKNFNDITPTMQFTIEEENNNQLNFLDFIIKKSNNKISFNIYQKPTTTDKIIPQESCHPIEHKLSAIRYLQNRNETYPKDPDCKLRERSIINHILRNNNYESTITHMRNNEPKTSRPKTLKTKWAKFTYMGPEVRYITKLFKPFDIGISFSTRNNINTLLRENNDNQDSKYDKNGVYQLTCTECKKKYTGQTGRPFHVRYKEHARNYKQGTKIELCKTPSRGATCITPNGRLYVHSPY